MWRWVLLHEFIDHKIDHKISNSQQLSETKGFGQVIIPSTPTNSMDHAREEGIDRGNGRVCPAGKGVATHSDRTDRGLESRLVGVDGSRPAPTHPFLACIVENEQTLPI